MLIIKLTVVNAATTRFAVFYVLFFKHKHYTTITFPPYFYRQGKFFTLTETHTLKAHHKKEVGKISLLLPNFFHSIIHSFIHSVIHSFFLSFFLSFLLSFVIKIDMKIKKLT